jgi:hypothetical protein
MTPLPPRQRRQAPDGEDKMDTELPFDRLRLWLCRLILPASHRLIEVCDVVTDRPMIQSDLIRGADALERGWNCDPAILRNAAAYIQSNHYGRRYMGQIMAECDCPREKACERAGRCLLEPEVRISG